MINTFFYPESIVFIGVSLTKLTLGRIALQNNLQRGFPGRLYGIGSEEGELDGVAVFKDIKDIPETPDVAVILTPARTVPDIISSCGEKGIKNVVIETGGFSEFSGEKEDLEKEVLDRARSYGIRLIGPNCVGASNAETGMMNAFAFFKREEKPSDLSFISQSGGIGNTFMRLVNDSHIFWNKFVSIGNKLDLDETDFLEYLLADKNTGKVLLYLESFKRGRKFIDLAIESDKPVMILKANRHPETAGIAQSHTTAISASDDIVDAAFRQAGITRVESEYDLRVAVKAFTMPPLRGNRVAVLSRSGGHAVMTADACAKYNLDMVPFPESFIEGLRDIYHTRVIAHQNPLDLGEIFDYTIFIKIVEETLKLDDIDGIIFNHMYQPSYEAEASRTFLDAVSEMAAKYNKPVSVSFTSNAEEIHDIEKNHPYPVSPTPLEAVLAMHISLEHTRRLSFRRSRGPVAEYPLQDERIKKIQTTCRDEKRIPLTDEALDICRAAGLSPVPSETVKEDQDVNTLSLGFPRVVKLLSRDASHKSDIGGVILNCNDTEETKRAIKTIKERAAADGSSPSIDGFLIQEMAPEGTEFFIGGRQDPSFGPVVVAGFGGIYIEIFKDRSMRLAPVTEKEADEMLRELHTFPILEGTRGHDPLDIRALRETICRVSWLLYRFPEIEEIDLNPVIVHKDGEGISIVDARVFFHDA